MFKGRFFSVKNAKLVSLYITYIVSAYFGHVLALTYLRFYTMLTLL